MFNPGNFFNNMGKRLFGIGGGRKGHKRTSSADAFAITAKVIGKTIAGLLTSNEIVKSEIEKDPSFAQLADEIAEHLKKLTDQLASLGKQSNDESNLANDHNQSKKRSYYSQHKNFNKITSRQHKKIL